MPGLTFSRILSVRYPLMDFHTNMCLAFIPDGMDGVVIRKTSGARMSGCESWIQHLSANLSLPVKRTEFMPAKYLEQCLVIESTKRYYCYNYY